VGNDNRLVASPEARTLGAGHGQCLVVEQYLLCPHGSRTVPSTPHFAPLLPPPPWLRDILNSAMRTVRPARPRRWDLKIENIHDCVEATLYSPANARAGAAILSAERGLSPRIGHLMWWISCLSPQPEVTPDVQFNWPADTLRFASALDEASPDAVEAALRIEDRHGPWDSTKDAFVHGFRRIHERAPGFLPFCPGPLTEHELPHALCSLMRLPKIARFEIMITTDGVHLWSGWQPEVEAVMWILPCEPPPERMIYYESQWFSPFGPASQVRGRLAVAAAARAAVCLILTDRPSLERYFRNYGLDPPPWLEDLMGAALVGQARLFLAPE